MSSWSGRSRAYPSRPFPWSGAFVHPGLLHSDQDFARMKAEVAANAQPWTAGWNRLVANLGGGDYGPNSGGYDQWGYGTLTSTFDPP
jgi:hypothetical protein